MASQKAPSNGSCWTGAIAKILHALLPLLGTRQCLFKKSQVEDSRRFLSMYSSSFQSNIVQSFWFIQSIKQTINQSIKQTINQSINQSNKQSINQSINQTNNQSINQTNNQSINQSNKQSINQSINNLHKTWTDTNRYAEISHFSTNLLPPGAHRHGRRVGRGIAEVLVRLTEELQSCAPGRAWNRWDQLLATSRFVGEKWSICSYVEKSFGFDLVLFFGLFRSYGILIEACIFMVVWLYFPRICQLKVKPLHWTYRFSQQLVLPFKHVFDMSPAQAAPSAAFWTFGEALRRPGICLSSCVGAPHSWLHILDELKSRYGGILAWLYGEVFLWYKRHLSG